MTILETAQKRYATKLFDKERPIAPETLQAVKDLLRLAPSSVNAQPWHFIMAETAAGKARVAKATEGPYSFNRAKVLDAGAIVVFCARTDMDDAYLQKLTAQEAADGRFATDALRDEQHAKRAMYVNMHKDGQRDLQQWATKQIYLNAGMFLLGVAALGLDAVPIEGFDPAALDREFDLRAKGLASAVMVAIGTRAAGDLNAALPKSRLPLTETLTVV